MHMRRREVNIWAREDIRTRERGAKFRAAVGRDPEPADFVVRRAGYAASAHYYFYDARADRLLYPAEFEGARGTSDPVATDALAFARTRRI